MEQQRRVGQRLQTAGREAAPHGTARRRGGTCSNGTVSTARSPHKEAPAIPVGVSTVPPGQHTRQSCTAANSPETNTSSPAMEGSCRTPVPGDLSSLLLTWESPLCLSQTLLV